MSTVPALAALSIALASAAAISAAPESTIVAPKTSVPTADVASKRLAAAFEKLRGEGFSGVAVIVHQGRTLLAGAAGQADPATGRNYAIDTPVLIGSLTKAVTAAAILKLQDEQRLSVSDPVSRHFPDAKGPLGSATIHHLLTHSSGLPLMAARPDGGTVHDSEPLGRSAFLERAFATPLKFAPGAGFTYSNAGYSLLAAIIEKASGQPYEQYVRRAVIEPAGVSAMGYRTGVNLAAAAHNRHGQSIEQTAWGAGGPYWNLLGNGGLLVDAQEFVRWRKAFADGRIVSKASVRLAGAPYANLRDGSGEGYGWIISPSATRGMVELAAGGSPEGTSEMRYYRDLDMIVFTATNGPRPAGLASGKLIAALFGEPEPQAGPPLSPGHQRMIQQLIGALQADSAGAMAFLDANVGPVFRGDVGLPEIARQFADVQARLKGARHIRSEADGQGSAMVIFDRAGSEAGLSVSFGGTPDAPRLAGFSLTKP